MSESNNFLISQRIGEKIRMFRNIKGLSLVEVATHVGVSAQQLQKYETGFNRVSADKLVHISEILEVSVIVLLGVEKRTEKSIDNYDKNLNKLIKNYNLIESKQLKQLLVFNSKVFVELGSN